MTAVVRLEWELRVRGAGKVALAALRPTSAGDVAEVVLDGTVEHIRASLYSALALLGDDGSQGRPPDNADELMSLVDPAKVFVPGQGVGGGGGAGGVQRGPVCAYCGFMDRNHSASCTRPDPQ